MSRLASCTSLDDCSTIQSAVSCYPHCYPPSPSCCFVLNRVWSKRSSHPDTTHKTTSPDCLQNGQGWWCQGGLSGAELWQSQTGRVWDTLTDPERPNHLQPMKSWIEVLSVSSTKFGPDPKRRCDWTPWSQGTSAFLPKHSMSIIHSPLFNHPNVYILVVPWSVWVPSFIALFRGCSIASEPFVHLPGGQGRILHTHVGGDQLLGGRPAT